MASSGTLTQPAESGAAPPVDLAWARVVARWERPIALLLAAVVFGTVQAATYSIIGIDGQYHIKVAALIREQGPRIDFPWLRFTILNEGAYTDHHLLFHLLQAPFTVLDLRVAGKVASAVFATLGSWGVYLVMARSGVRWPLAWLVVLLAVTHTFLWRHSMARPQSLALLLLVVVLWLIFERRWRWLVPAGFVSAWLFDGFILTLTVPLAALAARFLLERRLEWRPLVYVALGTALGLLVHPYFPHNVTFAALHLFPKGGLISQEQVRVGGEWYPYSPGAFARRIGPALAVMVFGLAPILVRLWRRERPDFPTLTCLFMGLGFLVLQVRSQRIVEYFPAFAVLLAAWSWSFNAPRPPERLGGWFRRHRPWLAALGVALLGVWLVTTVAQARSDARGAAPTARIESYRDAARWLAANSRPGSLVFNTDWDDFPQLFFWNTHNVYVVGLDPTYLSLYDLELFRLWQGISDGSRPNPSAAIRERFGAEHVMSDTRHARFLSNAAADPGLDEVFRSSTAVVFRVRPAPP